MLLEKIKYDADESYAIHESTINNSRLKDARKLSDYILVIYQETDLYGIYYPDNNALSIVYQYIRNLYISYYNNYVVKKKLEIIVNEELLHDFMKNGQSFKTHNHQYMLDSKLNVPFDTYIENMFEKSKPLKKYAFYTTDLYDVYLYLAFLLEYSVTKYCLE